MIKKLVFIICLLFVISCLGFTAEARQYDGLWFLGFNLHKDIFNDVQTRRAVAQAIDRKFITTRIFSEEVVPNGVIPPGMSGYDPAFRDVGYAPKKNKKLAGQTLVLLHTDGVKTVKAAQKIKKDLEAVGLKVKLQQAAYSNQDGWERELKSGRHHLFLMGYKNDAIETVFIGDKVSRLFHAPGCEKIPDADTQVIFGSYEEATSANYAPDALCQPKPMPKKDTPDLLNALFHSQGEANFTYYSNPRVDNLLDQLNQLDPVLSSLRLEKLKEANRLIVEDVPTVNLFYITRL